MDLEERIEVFSKLGNVLSNISDDRFLQILKKAEIQNPWFTLGNQKQTIKAWTHQLTAENLKAWLAPYNLVENNKSKNVLIIMAGNIPLVGFHDFLSVLISGNNAVIKMSSDDNVLLPFIIDELLKIEANFADKINFIEDVKSKTYDAVITTGNDNSAKYFDYYFKDAKKIIRKNGKSVAILDGEESKEELENLANDVFSYFGLGCRNVSKIFLPKDYDLNNLFEAFYPYQNIIEHKKYANNYDYADATRLEMTFWGDIEGWGDLQEKVRKFLVTACTQHVTSLKDKANEILESPLLTPIRNEITDVFNELAETRLTRGGKKNYHLMIILFSAI